MDGLHWPGYEIVCHSSVVEVVLEIPALFEDILILLRLRETDGLIYLYNIGKNKCCFNIDHPPGSFDAPCASWVVALLFENGTHSKSECRCNSRIRLTAFAAAF